MSYDFLITTYETERLKVLGVWGMFRDEDMSVRPRVDDARGRSVREQTVHQCVSENLWFRDTLGVDVDGPPLPDQEGRLDFMRRYATDSARRASALRTRGSTWWEEAVAFFDAERTRTWVMVRRIAHTAHHRGQQTALLRMLGRDVHSTYGPTADPGGLMQHNAPTIYPYPDESSLLEGEAEAGPKADLPGPGHHPPTERPGA